MLKLIQENNLNLTVDSAGTSSFHEGEAPDKRTISNALQHGVYLQTLRARQFKVSDFDNFDKIYVMDKSNLKNVLALATSDLQKEKVELFLNLLHPGQNMEVPDPYFGDEKDFEKVFQMIEKTCQKIAVSGQ